MFGDNDIYFDIRINNVENIKKYKSDIDFGTINEDGDTYLHYAIRCNSYDCARFFVKFIPVNSENKRGETALFYAAKMGKIELVKLLLRYEIDINYKNDLGEIALHYALMKGNLDVVKLLIEEGSDIKIKTKNSLTIANFAILGGDYNVFTYLHKKNYFDINQRDEQNNTLLHYICKTNNVKILKYILKYCLVNMKNNDKETPIFNAIRSGNLEIVKTLVLNGALIELENKYKESTFDFADTDMKQDLLEITEKHSYQMRIKKYPLMIAILKEDIDYIRYSRIDYNLKDNFNLTVKDYAKQVNNPEISKLIKWLLNYKVNGLYSLSQCFLRSDI